MQSAYTLEEEPDRIWGLAVNGMFPGNATSGPLGAVCGYVYTSSGYNEIVTTASTVKIGQWTHIVFTRSMTTSMHIYVNGVEQPVMVTSGSQNPVGDIKKGSELYFGGDFSGYIDEARISNAAVQPQTQELWLQWWFWVIMVLTVTAFASGAFYLTLNAEGTE